MGKFSKMGMRREKAAHWLRDGILTHGRMAVRGLEERMAAVLEEGEKMPDVMHFLDVLTRLLIHDARQIEKTDWEKSAETGQTGVKRHHFRNPAAKALRQLVVDIRKALRGLYGNDETNKILDLDGRTPRSYDELARFGPWLLYMLRNIPLPKSRLGKPPVEDWARQLEPLVKTFGEQKVEVDRRAEWRETHAADVYKEALVNFDTIYPPLIRLIESVYLLGGQSRLAGRLRPDFRRLVNRRAQLDPGAETETGLSGPWAPEPDFEPDTAPAEAAQTEGGEGGAEGESVPDGTSQPPLRKGSA